LTQLVLYGALPAGISQISFGVQKVKEKFLTTSGFFVVDQVISGIVKGINFLVSKLLWGLNYIPGGKSILQIVQNIISIFLTHIDEAVLSFIYSHDGVDAWTGARDGLILYFKNWKPLLVASAIMGVGLYLIGAILYGIFYFALMPLQAVLPSGMAIMFWIGILIIVSMFYGVFISPFILVTMVVTYQETIKAQEADSESQQKLEEMIPKFGEITGKAGNTPHLRAKVPYGSSSQPNQASGMPPLPPKQQKPTQPAQQSSYQSQPQSQPFSGFGGLGIGSILRGGQQTQPAQPAPAKIDDNYSRVAIDKMKDLKRKGLTDTQIKQMFLNKGWDGKMIDDLLRVTKDEIKMEKSAKPVYQEPVQQPRTISRASKSRTTKKKRR
jgi:hypothetical protein